MATRLLLAFSLAVLGAALGGLAIAAVAGPREGLEGGAKLALGLAFGAAAGLVAGGLTAWLADADFRRRLLMAALPLALALLAYGGWSWVEATRPPSDPPRAYAGLPVFTLSLEREPGSDPVLAHATTLDAPDREWRVELPDGRICRGVLRAEVQARVGEAALDVLPPPDPPPAACAAPFPESLTWRLEGAEPASGAISLDPACLSAMSGLSRLAGLVAAAPTLAESGAQCE